MTIYWAGDSTVQYNDFRTYPQTGIGQVMGLFLKEEILIKNHARNGRSTKSFIDEYRLAPIYDAIEEGDYLFIQFGHNDQKKEHPKGYAKAFGDYQVNLEKFINVALNKKAYPILVTPLSRRWFEEDGHMQAAQKIHGDYPEAVRRLGQELKVPVIDLFKRSYEHMEKVGPEESSAYFMKLEKGKFKNYPEGLDDNTHLRYEGAFVFAGMIADGLKELGGRYADLLIDVERV